MELTKQEKYSTDISDIAKIIRKQVKKVSDLNEFISGDRIPDCKPVLEEDMYILQYNNVLEEKASERK